MKRTVLTLAVVAAVVAAAAAVTLSVLSTDPAPAPAPSRTPDGRPPAIATSTGPFQAGPVAPPVSGSYLGAWVRPERLTESGRLTAMTTWEEALGRPMAIVNTYRRFDENFFNDSDRSFAGRGTTLMLSWAGGDTRLVTMGRYDELIRERARELRSFGRPVLLRYRWEMDRPNLRAQMWSGEDYVAAWRHVRRIFTEEGATNASWVWCPTAEGFTGGYAAGFYPGDDAVDWTCVDVYAGSKYATIGQLMRPFLEFCAAHPAKPVMIGEFGVARTWGTDQRAAWLRDASATFKANPQIRAVLYFESDPTDNKGPTQQFQLSDDPVLLATFRAEIAQDPHYTPMTKTRPAPLRQPRK
ncbi:endoglucanase [Dactylosporangium sp. AC04546]|uniref:glycoside hydrolase family 26 protein n=1 Tax=Dactylosporangium sp. AC04546 TaxID=2862460 RepID=UPI001EDFC612|nr:endoglucanase [Dactylosporangium sp. AC04546]WVK83098.1 endoglucanase [Dactylosporangium sp. AC04546]